MRIAIVGGNGQIARLLHPLLVKAGHQPVALARKEEYRADLESLGAERRLLDLENADDAAWDAALEGADAVVFAAGGGGDGSIERKKTVDLGGSLGAIAGATRLGIRRFVQISAIGVDRPADPDLGEVWAAYVAAKRDADVALRQSELDWTVLRPGRLTDDAATGLVDLGPEAQRGDVTRADVAATVAALLERDETIGRQWNVVGGETPVAEAVDAALAADS
ncbi:SDR family oxidoreductase [Nocardioides sp.]|uniref:SDR family oxidoreductase n=1 Tax=Nocardioides sp. TaxID=35761 RepID=UPI0035162C08